MQSLGRLTPHMSLFKALLKIQILLLNLLSASHHPPYAHAGFVITLLLGLKLLIFSMPRRAVSWGLLNCQGGDKLIGIFPDSGNFSSQRKSLSWPFELLMDAVCASTPHQRWKFPRKGLQEEMRKERWREGEFQQLSFPVWQVVFFFLFQVSLCLSSPFILNKLIWWIQLLKATSWFILLLPGFNCKGLCRSLGRREALTTFQAFVRKAAL